jgi:hypothetical protein
LIKFCNHGQGPAEMPPFFWLSPEMVLVRSNKGDSYYVTMAKDCSCPARHWQPGKTCKHQREFFPTKEALRSGTMGNGPEPKEEDARLRAAPDLRDNIIAAMES